MVSISLGVLFSTKADTDKARVGFSFAQRVVGSVKMAPVLVLSGICNIFSLGGGGLKFSLLGGRESCDLT